MKRYKTGGYGAMVEDEAGPWVAYEDAAALSRDEAREAPDLVALVQRWQHWLGVYGGTNDPDEMAEAQEQIWQAEAEMTAWTPAAPSAAPEVETRLNTSLRQLAAVDRALGFPDGHGSGRVEMVETLRAELAAARAEIAAAMEVLAPNVPESGLVDACRQIKQVAISEADNSEVAEKQLAAARAALENVMGLFDTPLWRVKIVRLGGRTQAFYTEAMKTARAVLAGSAPTGEKGEQDNA